MPKKAKEQSEWVDDDAATGAAEKTVKKGKKDKKAKKNFFEELSTDSKPEMVEEVAVKEPQGKQKKKRELKKGKPADAGEKDDEDVMLKLKKLSVQASDEEDEPVITTSKVSKKYSSSGHSRGLYRCEAKRYGLTQAAQVVVLSQYVEWTSGEQFPICVHR
ncbi:ATP-binding cassette sub-family F member 1-like [Nematolebias whitei]|uniref:ATP-binding cassette sub-family F member 1-like n=1 Tax=Nematolebias whitei TaxID=451745 RepID=UPI001899EF33|nr:ATP-binding cassette sub-family F member 1-like [Nematolebias whitei]